MGCLDMTDPLSLGFIGRNGAYPANQAGRHADVVLEFVLTSVLKWIPAPVTRSRTVSEVRSSAAWASPMTRAAMLTAMPDTCVFRRSMSPAWMPTRTSSPSAWSAARSASPPCTALVADVKTARTPSPVVSMTVPPCWAMHDCRDAVVTVELSFPVGVAEFGGALG